MTPNEKNNNFQRAASNSNLSHKHSERGSLHITKEDEDGDELMETGERKEW